MRRRTRGRHGEWLAVPARAEHAGGATWILAKRDTSSASAMQFDLAQTQLEAAFDATPRRELSAKLVRTLMANSIALGRQDQMGRYIEALKQIAPGDPR